MEDKIMKNLHLINRKLSIMENQLAKMETILPNSDYIKNSLEHLKIEKQKHNGMTSNIAKLCEHIKNLTIKKYKRNQETCFFLRSLHQRRIRTII